MRENMKMCLFLNFFFLILMVSSVKSNHDGSDDPLDWLRESVPGEPGVDYPVFAEVEETGFDCSGRIHGGYYADLDMGCQGYHVCLTESDLPRKVSFLCPNGTIFNQEILVCEWWFNVDCASAESFYNVNELIGVEDSLSGSNQGRKTENRPKRPRPQPQQPQRPRQQQQQPRPQPKPQQPQPQRPRQQQQKPQVQQPKRPRPQQQRPKQQQQQQPRRQPGPQRPVKLPAKVNVPQQKPQQQKPVLKVQKPQRQPGKVTPQLAQRPLQTPKPRGGAPKRPRPQQQRPERPERPQNNRPQKPKKQVKLRVVAESEREQEYSTGDKTHHRRNKKPQQQKPQQRPKRPQAAPRPQKKPQQQRPRKQPQNKPDRRRPLPQVDIVTYDATLGDEEEEDSGVPLLFADPFVDVRRPQSPNRLYDAPPRVG